MLLNTWGPLNSWLVVDSGALMDLMFSGTGDVGVVDGQAAFFSKLPGEHRHDAERRYLIAQGAAPGQLMDMWREYLAGLGYAGSINSARRSFWGSQ